MGLARTSAKMAELMEGERRRFQFDTGRGEWGGGGLGDFTAPPDTGAVLLLSFSVSGRWTSAELMSAML